MRAAIYYRVSTPGQVDAYGFDAQKTLLPEYCAKQGWQVAGTSSEGLANRVKADTALLGGVIATRGIKAE